MRGLLLALAVLSPVTAAANVAPPPGDLSPMMLVSFTPPAVTCAQGSPRLIEGVTPSPASGNPGDRRLKARRRLRPRR